MDLVHAAIQLFGSLPLLIQAGAAVIVSLGVLFGAIATARARWKKLVRSGTATSLKARSKSNRGANAKNARAKSEPARPYSRTQSTVVSTDSSAHVQNPNINPTINPTISPTISPQFHIHLPTAPANVQTADSQSPTAQPLAEGSVGFPPLARADALSSNTGGAGARSTSVATATDAAPTVSTSDLSIAPAMKQDTMHIGPAPDGTGDVEVKERQAQAQTLDPGSPADPSAIPPQPAIATTAPKTDDPDVDTSAAKSAEPLLGQQPAPSEVPNIVTSTPSGRLLFESQIRQQSEIRSNMRRALRNASIIVQEARLSLQKYTRTSSSERPFQNEVRVLGVLHDYLQVVEGTFSALNSAMIKLDVDWIGGDPRRVLLAFPDPFSPAFQTEDSLRSASELRRTLLSTLENMVATARSINLRVERRSYSNPSFPNTSWVYVIPKKYDEPLDDAVTNDFGGEMTETNDVVGDEDLGEAVDQEVPNEDDR